MRFAVGDVVSTSIGTGVVVSTSLEGEVCWYEVDVDGAGAWVSEGEIAGKAEARATVTDEEAARIVDALLSYEERIARVEEQSARVLSRLRARQARYREYAHAALLQYYDEHKPRRGRTIHTVAGDISMRTVRGGPRVEDKDAVIAWASDAAPFLISSEMVYRVHAEELKSYVASTGEIPPGVAVRQDEERMYVRAPNMPSKGEE